MSNKAPLAWVRKISAHLRAYDHVPLYGHAPLFDWDRFSALAASHFGVPHLSIQAKGHNWRAAEDLKEGLGDEVLTWPLKVGPLNGSAFWMMSQENVAKFTSWMLGGNAKLKPLSSELFAEGFYRFLLLEILDAATAMEPFQHLSATLSETSPMPDTDAFCIDVAIQMDKRTCWGRLAIEPSLQKSWALHFASAEPAIPPSLKESLELSVGVKVGSVHLQKTEWEKLTGGDVVLLDSGGYDARKGTGVASLTLGATPLFQVKIKQNKIQLLDYAGIYEEEMEKSVPPEPSEQPFSGPTESFPPEEGEVMSIKETPVFVTVELARLKMTLGKLTELSPGNLIELPIHPDQGVHLTVNGQLVGRAELVHLGETLGIRILDIG
ncbi:MAG: type III secretion system cytoplasmic ring protein SctQ [Verrucomicrobiota bacterium]|nr:type III secretion system cytoplasmic ring protein SctQ [Verrucomicrobiota bacterium]